MEKNIIVNEYDRIIRYTGNIEDENGMLLIDTLHNLIIQEPRDTVYLYLYTYGGDYDAVMAIYDFIKTRETPITTIGVGSCMSGGSLLIASGTGERFSYPNTRFMIHGLQAGIGYNSHVDNRIHMDENDRIDENFSKLLAKETGNDIDTIINDLKRDKYLTAEEAIKYGLIDDIIR